MATRRRSRSRRRHRSGPADRLLDRTLRISNPASALRDLDVRSDTVPVSVAGGTADRMISQTISSAVDQDGCQVEGGTLLNSVCIARYVGSSSAMSFQEGVSSTLRGSTVVGPNFGLYVNTFGTATVANSILQGGTRPDLYVNVGSVDLLNDAFSTKSGDAPASESGTVSAEPVFRGAEDLRPAAGSPTIDAGSDAASAGTYDLNGNLRKIGATVDIGAYEFVPVAPALPRARRPPRGSSSTGSTSPSRRSRPARSRWP